MMSRFVLPTYRFTIFVFIAFLSGCSEPPLQSSVPLSSDASVKGSALTVLYVSAPDVGMGIFTYPDLSPVTNNGNTDAVGLCADKKGNVYAAEIGLQELIEYQAGTLTQLRTVADPNYAPQSCAVNLSTGELAIINFSASIKHSQQSKTGSIAIYQSATGIPKIFKKTKSINYFFYGTYDDKGDLFVDGIHAKEPNKSKGTFGLAELPAGSKELVDITLNHTIGRVGDLHWEGKYLVISDALTSNLYRFAIEGTSGTLVSTTTLQNTSALPGQFAVQKDLVTAVTYSSIGVWSSDGSGPQNTLDIQNATGLVLSTSK